MATADLALGRTISVDPVPDEIIWYLLGKEFGWSPKQIKAEDAKDIQAMTHIVSTYNRVKNQISERESRTTNSSRGGSTRTVERESL